MVGQRYVNPTLKFTFSVPSNHALQISKGAVVGAGEGEAVRFDSAEVLQTMALEDYLKSGWIAGLQPGSPTREHQRLRHGVGRRGHPAVELPCGSGAARGPGLPLHLRRQVRQPRFLEGGRRDPEELQGDPQRDLNSVKQMAIRTVTAGSVDTADLLARKMAGLGRGTDLFYIQQPVPWRHADTGTEVQDRCGRVGRYDLTRSKAGSTPSRVSGASSIEPGSVGSIQRISSISACGVTSPLTSRVNRSATTIASAPVGGTCGELVDRHRLAERADDAELLAQFAAQGGFGNSPGSSFPPGCRNAVAALAHHQRHAVGPGEQAGGDMDDARESAVVMPPILPHTEGDSQLATSSRRSPQRRSAPRPSTRR